MTKQSNTGYLRIPVKPECKPREDVALRAYLFDKDEKLIDSVAVRNDEAVFKVGAEKLQRPKLLIAPDTDTSKRERDFKALEITHKAFQPLLDLSVLDQVQIVPIPEYFFDFWYIRRCTVKGNVSKYFNINGVSEKIGLCDMRVHICEVDTIHWLLPRIPDDILVKIPDLFINPEIEIPVPVLPTPPVPPIPPIDFIPRPIDGLGVDNPFSSRSLDLSVTSKKFDAKAFHAAAVPILRDEILLAEINSTSPQQIRTAILNNFQIFHPVFCLVPWLWPYFYRCDEVATVYTDEHGDFETSIWYHLFGDKPDLYFWVEAYIDGEWTTVYKPKIPCATRWNYACGSPVNITIWDGRVQAECSDVLNGELVFVQTIRDSASVHHIEQKDISVPHNGVPLNRQGLTDLTNGNNGNHRSPFGTGLFFKVQFSDLLPSQKYTYYRWSYRKVKHADLSPAANVWKPMSNTVRKQYSYRFQDIFGHFHIDFDSERLGPETVDGEENLYLIPTVSPTMSPFNVTKTAARWGANTNTMGFDSTLDGDGLYEFKMELFDKDGNQITKIPKELFQIPDKATYVPSVNATNPYLIPLSIGTPSDIANYCQGYRMKVRLDNSKCKAEIYKIKVNGVEADPTCCGFVPYTSLNAQNIEIRFKAMHPQNFADLSFVVQKGTCNDGDQKAKTNAYGMVNSDAPTVQGLPYDRNSSSIYSKFFSAADLLGDCTSGGKAAFAERVYVDALAVNGNRRIDSFDASDLAAFALEPSS